MSASATGTRENFQRLAAGCRSYIERTGSPSDAAMSRQNSRCGFNCSKTAAHFALVSTISHRRAGSWFNIASDRAVGKAYGPRKLGILQTRADIFVGRGDLPAARRTLEEAIAMAESLPEGQRSEGTIRSLHKKMEGLKQD